MAADSGQNPRVWVDPNNARDYHEAFLKLTPDMVAAAKEKLLDPTERDIVKYWETQKA